MSKRRISDTQRNTRGSGKSDRSDINFYRFAGVCLSGGKNSKTVVAVLDYFPAHHRIVLSQIIDFSEMKEEVSQDEMLLSSLRSLGENLKLVAFDAPLSLPTCITCKLRCPGLNLCTEPHIKWFWEQQKETKKAKKNLRQFTPYTQRPIEAWLNSELEETFHPSDAMGANVAPLTARMQFLIKHIDFVESVEVFPKVSLWRMGRSLKVTKKHLRFHKHAVDGDKSRAAIVKGFVERAHLFVYQADQAKLISNGNVFDAFLCAMTAFLSHRNLTEPRPSDFPIDEAWIEIPVENCL